MKGIVHIIEVLITGVILVMAFMFFFPQYSIKSKWDSVLLYVRVRDTLNTIERLNKTYDFAVDNDEFNGFMNSTFIIERGAIIWWKQVDSLPGGVNMQIPYFTEGYRENIIDVMNVSNSYVVYTFTLGLGYPY
jgi:hypothetical protein